MSGGEQGGASQSHFELARAGQHFKRGDVAAAWSAVERVITTQDPGVPRVLQRVVRDVSAERLRLLASEHRFAEVVDTATHVVEFTCGEAGDEVYQLQNDALFELGGPDLAQRHHRLIGPDRPVASDAPGTPIAALVVRNGMWRLESWLETLRAQGMRRFLVIDNDSSDGTAEHAAAQPDVTLWRTDASFSRANSGAAWFDVLFRQHAHNTWTLVLDVDEEIRIAGDRSIPDFCRRLDQAGAKAVTGHHIDLYNRPHSSDLYLERDAVIELAGAVELFPGHSWESLGLRQRVFDETVVANKAPLQRFEPGLRLCLGQHFSWHEPDAIAHTKCAVLHYKFTAGFVERTSEIAANADHHPTWRDQNARYARIGSEHELFDEQRSVRFTGTDQLVELGMLEHLEAVDA